MSWRNHAENLLITLISVIVGVAIGYKVSVTTSRALVSGLIPTIDKAIDKETIKNEISNQIDVQIDKIKKSDSIHIVVAQDPVNDQDLTATVPPAQIVQKSCKDGWVCVPVNTLSRKQKKLLKN